MDSPRREAVAAAAVAVMAACICGAAAQAAVPTYMSCGRYTIKYVAHPRSCDYSVDGTEAGRFIFESIHWTKWGSPSPRAVAQKVDNHDQDHNGFQRHRVTLRLIGRFGEHGRRYYRTMIVEDQGTTYRVPLVSPQTNLD